MASPDSRLQALLNMFNSKEELYAWQFRRPSFALRCRDTTLQKRH